MTAAAPLGIRWRRVNLGLYLIGFGTLLLLTSTGRLGWTFWLDAAAFWPLLLVGLGLRILFERSPTPGLMVLSPLLVFGALTYAALQPPQPWDQQWTSLHTDRPQDVTDWTFRTRLVRAELDVAAGDLPETALIDGRAACERGTAELSARGLSGGYRIEARTSRKPWNVLRNRQRWELKLARHLPLHVDLELAFASGRVDLGGAPVRRLELEGAFNDVVIRLDAPAQDVKLDVHGAFNTVTLLVPPATPVHVRSEGALLSVQHPNEASAREGPGYRVSFEGFSSTLDIRPAPMPAVAALSSGAPKR